MSVMDPDRPTPEFLALHVPPAAIDDGGVEVVRAVIVEGELHIALRRAFDDPESWGVLLADLTRHIARMYAAETELAEHETLQRVRAMYESEMETPSDLGTTRAISRGEY
jgi:hypothetical protein